MQLRNIELPDEQIAAFCRRWQIVELALFGSVLRDDFRPDSDIDVLVSFAPAARWTLFDFVHMQRELETMFGRKVDLVEKAAIEDSENYLRRQNILNSYQPVYGT